MEEPTNDPGRSFETLGQGENRPVLDLYLAGLVGLPENRIRRVRRKAVPRVCRDDLLEESPSEEHRTEGANAGHDQSETRILPPKLAGQLACAGGPPAVTEHDVDGVPSLHMSGHRIRQRGEIGTVRPKT
jgi:hypothetical protein